MTVVLLLGALLAVVVAGETQVQISGSEDDCTRYCAATYHPHTNAFSGGEEKACASGCRLWSISRLADGGLEEAAVTESCLASCGESFKGRAEELACAKGCRNQKPHRGPQHVEMVISSVGSQLPSGDSDFWGSAGLLKQRVLQHFNDFFNTDRDPFAEMDQQIRRFQSQVEAMFRRTGASEPELGFQRPPEIVREPPALGDRASDGRPIVFVELEPFQPANDRFEQANTLSSLFEGAHEPSPPVFEDLRTEAEQRSADPEAGWMHEAARRMERLGGVRRGLLCVGLALSAAVFVWVALLALRTAPRRRLLRTRAEALAALAKSKMSPPGGLSGSGEKASLVRNEVVQPAPPPYAEKDESLPARVHATPAPTEPTQEPKDVV